LTFDISELGELGWEITEEYVKVFKPFKVFTASVSSATSPTISIRYQNEIN
jgi:hypothetical protein